MENQEEEIFNNRIELGELALAVSKIKNELGKVIIGQQENIDLLITSLLCGGHVLMEGVPGVAKTLTAKLLAQAIDISFKRIQFTPDLMPSDVLGTSVFNPKSLEFEYKRGPIFSNIILIDEINRSPPKTQAALFELMEEKQVTIDGQTFPMQQPFLVLATQNPIEQEGTYRLPEAQLDRFFMKILVDYPKPDEEIELLKKFNYQTQIQVTETVNAILGKEQILSLKETIQQIIIEDHLLKFITDIVQATRNHKQIALGGSPRASLALMQASKALAAISGRDFVIPEDIKTIGLPVLRHRIILTADSEMEGITEDEVLGELFNTMEIPR
ncbi:MoxR family ATPase [Lacihabitans sp. LS3-19]|uniref:AAA family ATPase n=1 Tax=Lacihabitans sp. LS3-19 TaxID=2487335 RepID=UPI0020CB88CB|nr:MoxR family ATPase [Lacihabitans sp. LS3-19]MCP9768525.1 MoxR family ATPase [Lacihabitans sp. LS3-19]